MPIHPKLQEIINQTKSAKLPPQKYQPLPQVRESFLQLRLLAGDPEPVFKIVTESIPTQQGSMLIRLYYPVKKEKLPILLYFHPGGFVKGDLESHDPICRMLANQSAFLVISINYRLAPEFKFPSAIEDSYDALVWVYKNAHKIGGDERKIALCGENSGGNIAAVITHLAKEKKGPKINYQVLICPLLDFTYSFPSHKEFSEGYLLDESSLFWYKQMYLSPKDDLKNPLISPLWAKDFSHLPSALVITSTYDPLRDEAEAYTKKLKAAGVHTILKRYEGMTHGFFQMPGILDEAKKAIIEVALSLKTRGDKHG